MTTPTRALSPDAGTSAPGQVPDLADVLASEARTPAPLPVPDLTDLVGAESTVTPPRRPVPGHLAVLAGAAVAMVLLVAGLMTTVVGTSNPGSHQGSAFAAGARGNHVQAGAHPSLHLAPATTAPAPAPPSLASAPPVQSHEVFGYAPYWTLPQSTGFDLKNLTTLAYFSVDVNADGTLNQSGPGWNGYQSQDLVDLVTRAHAAGDRVVLTVTCFDQVTSDPGAPARLASALVAAVQAKSLDGVNIDFEGLGSGDRTGLSNLVTKVSAALHAADPHWQVSMAVYASAAGDPGGFVDVATVAPAVDVFFVMAYDMNSRTQPSATSPLSGPAFSDVTALQEFTRVVPPSKVILGLPFYGYDWPTVDATPTSAATGTESPLSDAVIASGAHPTYWDPVTDTPWTAYQVGTQWHRTYFDDPTSLALKAQLANFFHIAGVGIWALGMDGNNPAMLAALLGNAPVAKDVLSGPAPGTGFLTFATYAGTTNLLLTPIAPPLPVGTVQVVGNLSGIGTTDPALACLQSGPPLPVLSVSTQPGTLFVQATTPGDCASALWSFPVPPPAVAPATTTTTGPLSTTTTGPPSSTTQPPSTTTTTSSPSSTSTSTTTTSPTTTTTTTASTTGP